MGPLSACVALIGLGVRSSVLGHAMGGYASSPGASCLRRVADDHNHASIGVLRKRNGVSNSYHCISEFSSYMVNRRKELVDRNGLLRTTFCRLCQIVQVRRLCLLFILCACATSLWPASWLRMRSLLVGLCRWLTVARIVRQFVKGEMCRPAWNSLGAFLIGCPVLPTLLSLRPDH